MGGLLFPFLPRHYDMMISSFLGQSAYCDITIADCFHLEYFHAFRNSKNETKQMRLKNRSNLICPSISLSSVLTGQNYGKSIQEDKSCVEYQDIHKEQKVANVRQGCMSGRHLNFFGLSLTLATAPV